MGGGKRGGGGCVRLAGLRLGRRVAHLEASEFKTTRQVGLLRKGGHELYESTSCYKLSTCSLLHRGNPCFALLVLLSPHLFLTLTESESSPAFPVLRRRQLRIWQQRLRVESCCLATFLMVRLAK